MVILLDAWPASGDSRHAHSFTAYRNYVVGLDRLLGIEFGAGDGRLTALAHASRALPAVRAMKRRSQDAALDEIKASLQRSWGLLRALRVSDTDPFVAEFNATIPTNAYYAVYHALRAARLALEGLNRPGFCIRSSKILRGLQNARKEGIHA